VSGPPDPERSGTGGPSPAEITVYGRRSVLEALASPGATPLRVWWDRRLPADLRRELAARCRERGIEGTRTDRSGVHEVSRAPRHDQGLAARVRLEHVLDVEGFLQGCRGPRAARPIGLLALDGLTNSQNVGLLVRSAVAAGIDAVVWPQAGTPWMNGLVLKSSAAAAFACRIVRCPSLEEALPALQAAGFTVYGLAPRAAGPLAGHRPPHRALYVVGNETTGLSPGVEALLDDRIAIPVRAPVESLNAAVAGSLVAFHWASCAEASSAS